MVYGPLGGASTSDDADATFVGAYAYDYTGWAVGAGDIDGDGADDLLVGSPWATGGGRVDVHLSPLPEHVGVGDAAAAFIGGSLTGYAVDAGDVDFDGQDDVAVGCEAAPSIPGAAYVMYGPISGNWDLELDADARFEGPKVDGSAGGSAVVIADVDVDGLGDLLVGAQAGHESKGSAYVLLNGY